MVMLAWGEDEIGECAGSTEVKGWWELVLSSHQVGSEARILGIRQSISLCSKHLPH